MKRVNFFLPEEMISALKALAKRKGVPYSELVREGINTYLKTLPSAHEPEPIGGTGLNADDIG